MHGAIAAGSEATADAGAEVLRRGGNAVDAVVAACFATAAGEPTLTSLAGAGVMIHRDAQTGEITICDFFANAPGLGGAQPSELDFFEVQLDFGPAKQGFHIGRGAAAVPGAIPGLCSALERWGRLPLADVVQPACRMLRDGVVLGPWQDRAARLLEPILLYSEQSRRQFGSAGRLISAGDRYRIPELADTLEQLAAAGWRRYYQDVFEPTMVAQFGPDAGGTLTAEDLRSYQVEFRQPLHFSYRSSTIFTNPPPAAGGQMVALMLALLARLDLGAIERGSAEHVRLLGQIMRVADEARRAGRVDGSLERWRRRLDALRDQPLGAAESTPAGPGSTTHVSAVDEAGGGAAVTFSYGEGNGHLIGNTGIMMNNLMGEEDLHPAGFHQSTPGARLSTMMAPTVVVDADGALSVVGTGGANRIRTALLQVISNIEDFGCSPGQAVAAARVHFEQGVLNAEVFDLPDHGAALAELGAPVLVRFEEPNLFFGGVHLARRAADGTLDGAGDPRRGGVLRVV